ncbi:MAG: FecR domain-containing protein [Niabella sp.]
MTQLTPYGEYLLLGKLSNTLDEDEVRALNLLWQENPDLAVAYEHLVQQLPADKVKNGFQEADASEFWDDLKTRLRNNHATVQAQPAASPRHLHFFRRYRAAAAIILFITTIGSLLWFSTRHQENTKESVGLSKPSIELKLADGTTIDLSTQVGDIKANGAALNNSGNTLTFKIKSDNKSNSVNTLTVPAGLDYKVHLEDGTEVWMNSASELQFPSHFSGTSREISIRGEAYLKVTKNPEKPFIVHLPKSTVQVLGTEFNVNTYSQHAETIALVEGSVQLNTPVGESKLSPGKEAVYIEGKPILIKTFDPSRTLSWQKGLFYFDEMKLSDICAIIPRWFGMQVTIDNPSTGNKVFVGVLDRNQPITVFQDDLKIMADVDSYIDKNNILHFK